MDGLIPHHFWNSIKRVTYWKHALFSPQSRETFLSSLGAIWLILEIFDFFQIINQADIPSYGIVYAMLASVVIVLHKKRPISKICYKIPRKDISIEVFIGDLFSCEGQKIISTNNTFDTNTENNLIATNSLQGQFSQKYFQGNIHELDQKIENSLEDREFHSIENPVGKNKRYDIGTVARIALGRDIFYMLAIAELDENGTAITDLVTIKRSLENLWEYISYRGETDPIVIPLLGTGRGRITTSRKEMIGIHARSFVEASENRIFSNKLVIVISPDDAKNFDINLFEIKDYLAHILSHY
jgi:hypothetical protein